MRQRQSTCGNAKGDAAYAVNAFTQVTNNHKVPNEAVKSYGIRDTKSYLSHRIEAVGDDQMVPNEAVISYAILNNNVILSHTVPSEAVGDTERSGYHV